MQAVRSNTRLAIVRFTEIARGAKCLQVVERGFSAFTPRYYVVNLKFNAGG